MYADDVFVVRMMHHVESEGRELQHTPDMSNGSRQNTHNRLTCTRLYKNSSGDEIANVNFFCDDTLHALQNIVRC